MFYMLFYMRSQGSIPVPKIKTNLTHTGVDINGGLKPMIVQQSFPPNQTINCIQYRVYDAQNSDLLYSSLSFYMY